MSAQNYTVQAGDTLSKIAEKLYRDSNQWRFLYEANRNLIGSNPEQIQVGMVLTHIPHPQAPLTVTKVFLLGISSIKRVK